MNEVTARVLDDVTQRIAYKFAKDYGLIDKDFAIRFWPSKKFDYTIKAGGIIRVYFTHTPKFVDYEAMLRRCLMQVASIKKNKKTGIMIYGSDRRDREELSKIAPEWNQLPTLLPFEDLLMENLYKVVLVHRKTGLTIIKEGKIGKSGKSIPRLVIDARLELTDLVNALEKARGELASVKVELDETRLKLANYGDSGSEG